MGFIKASPPCPIPLAAHPFTGPYECVVPGILDAPLHHDPIVTGTVMEAGGKLLKEIRGLVKQDMPG